MEPGFANPIRAGIEKPFVVASARPEAAVELIERKEEQIRAAFLADLLPPLPLQDRMTTVEVIQRSRDAMNTLAPHVNAWVREYLTPTIKLGLAHDIKMKRLGDIPPRFQEAMDKKKQVIKIEYVSPLVLSQKSAQVNAVQLWYASAIQVGQVDPQTLIGIKHLSVQRFLAKENNVPLYLMSSESEFNAQLQEIKQQQQQAQQVQSGREIAAGAKDASAAVKNLVSS